MPDANTFLPSGALYTWRESQGQQTTHQQQRTPRSQEKTPQYLSVVQWPSLDDRQVHGALLVDYRLSDVLLPLLHVYVSGVP